MIVVSGGIKAIIDVTLENALAHAYDPSESKADKSYSDLLSEFNMKVLSNEFIFNDKFDQNSGSNQRTVIDYDRRILHSMNKKEFVNQIQME